MSRTFWAWPIMIIAIPLIRLQFLARPLSARSSETLLTRDALLELSRSQHRPLLERIRSFHRQLRVLTWCTTASVAPRRSCCRPTPRQAFRVLPFSNYCPKRKHISHVPGLARNMLVLLATAQNANNRAIPKRLLHFVRLRLATRGSFGKLEESWKPVVRAPTMLPPQSNSLRRSAEVPVLDSLRKNSSASQLRCWRQECNRGV